MKKTVKIFTTSAILFLLFFPALGFVRAQNNDYTLLAPLPGISSTANCADGGTPAPIVRDSNTGTITGGCQTTLSQYLPKAFDLIIGIAAVLAFIMLTYGGVLYMTSDAITGKSQGKEYITNALWGLGLAIASYVILFTIGGPNMLSFTLQLAQPKTVMQAPDLLSALASSNAAGQPVTGQPMTPAQIDASYAIEALLGQTSHPCTQGQTTGCVNFNGLQPNTITGIQDLANDCKINNGGTDCGIVITGGTEAGHDANGSHSLGTAVDISATTALANSIKTDYTFTSSNSDGSCPIYTDAAGDTYLYEVSGDKCGGAVASTGAPHFHVTYK